MPDGLACVAFELILAALALEVLVVGHLAGGFLRLALGPIHGALGLVLCAVTHGGSLLVAVLRCGSRSLEGLVQTLCPVRASRRRRAGSRAFASRSARRASARCRCLRRSRIACGSRRSADTGSGVRAPEARGSRARRPPSRSRARTARRSRRASRAGARRARRACRPGMPP